MKNFSTEKAIALMTSIASKPTENIGNIALVGCALAAIGVLKTFKNECQNQYQNQYSVKAVERTYYLQASSFLSISLGYALRDVSSYVSLGLIAFGSVGSIVNINLSRNQISMDLMPLSLFVPAMAMAYAIG